MTPLRIAFFGTPAFAVPTLRTLLESRHDVAVVVTQPDRRRGRGQQVRPEAVKSAAVEAGIPVLQPEKLKVPEFREAFAAFGVDLGVVAAYGRILPEDLIREPRLGMINVHASLLPRWRGAAPVHRAILAGDTVSGVTIMRVVKALDAGPMLAHVATPIDPDETSAELERRLAVLGARLLVETVGDVGSPGLREVAQNEGLSTYAARLEKRESAIDWCRPAVEVHNQIRGLQPWPLAAATFLGHRTQLLRSRVAHNHARGVPGTVTAVLDDAFEVATDPGAVRILELQVAGRGPAPVRAFLQGHRVSVGDVMQPLEAQAG